MQWQMFHSHPLTASSRPRSASHYGSPRQSTRPDHSRPHQYPAPECCERSSFRSVLTVEGRKGKTKIIRGYCDLLLFVSDIPHRPLNNQCTVVGNPYGGLKYFKSSRETATDSWLLKVNIRFWTCNLSLCELNPSKSIVTIKCVV